MKVFYKQQIGKILEKLEEPFDLSILGPEEDIKKLQKKIEKGKVRKAYESSKKYLVYMLYLKELKKENFEKMIDDILGYIHQTYLPFDLIFHDKNKKEIILTHDGDVIEK